MSKIPTCPICGGECSHNSTADYTGEYNFFVWCVDDNCDYEYNYWSDSSLENAKKTCLAQHAALSALGQRARVLEAEVAKLRDFLAMIRADMEKGAFCLHSNVDENGDDWLIDDVNARSEALYDVYHGIDALLLSDPDDAMEGKAE